MELTKNGWIEKHVSRCDGNHIFLWNLNINNKICTLFKHFNQRRIEKVKNIKMVSKYAFSFIKMTKFDHSWIIIMNLNVAFYKIESNLSQFDTPKHGVSNSCLNIWLTSDVGIHLCLLSAVLCTNPVFCADLK